MAAIRSIQSGSWSNPATWDSASIPDPAQDDVRIVAGTQVTIESGTHVSLMAGNSLFLESQASLTVHGSLTLINVAYGEFHGQLLIASSGQMTVSNSASASMAGSTRIQWPGVLNIQENGYVDVTDQGTLVLRGTIQIVQWSYLMVMGTMAIEPGASVTCFLSGYLNVNSPGVLTVDGSVDGSDSGQLRIAGGRLMLTRLGMIQAFFGGSFVVGSGGQADIVGDLRVDLYSQFEIADRAILRLWRSITLAGNLLLNGSVRLMRREVRVLNTDGTARLALDQAYGTGPVLIL